MGSNSQKYVLNCLLFLDSDPKHQRYVEAQNAEKFVQYPKGHYQPTIKKELQEMNEVVSEEREGDVIEVDKIQECRSQGPVDRPFVLYTKTHIYYLWRVSKLRHFNFEVCP